MTRHKKFLYNLVGIALFLVIAQISLPFAVRRYVLHTLNKIPGYRAQVGALSINLFRGAYQIQQIKLEKIKGKVPVPFFSADTIDLSVEWSELFHGALVGKIEIQHPFLNFVNGRSAETSQTSMDKSWVEHVKELFPLKINRFEANNGEIHFRDFSRKPNVDLFMAQTHIIAVNLTNSRRLSQTLVATIDAGGVVPQNGQFKFHLEADPLAEKPTFRLAAQMTDVDLKEWNNFLEAYGGVDAAQGTFDVFTEMQVDHGNLQGYIKPILKHLEIAHWKDAQESPLKVVWEMIVAGVAEILKNQPKDQIATRIPLSGSINNPSPGIIATIGELLRNAYIQALFPSLEGFLGKGKPANGDLSKPAQ